MTQPPAPAFEDAAQTWNRRFDTDEFLFGVEPNAWLREHARLLPPRGRVLCVADGEGRNSVWLARQGFEVEAFDIAEIGVAKARRLADSHGVRVEFQVCGCDDYAWPQARFDGVAAIFVQFADPAQRKRLFERIVASLRPGGILVLQGYTPKQLDYRTGGPPFASHLYTPQLLRDELAALEILELREYEADVAEGSGHCGRSALIGLTARRR
ncbi:MAG TPA: class I SAM-dependent methyltransferase [Burkholderiaceae bacterium]|nr:class I SAM-dependent methyltransferase [Burkholderiaceae bacterium]